MIKYMGMLMEFIRWVPGYFFPKTCYGCGKEGLYVCPKCRSQIERVFDRPICPVCSRPSPVGATHPQCVANTRLDGLTSFYRYDGWAKAMIRDAKFGNPRYFKPMVELTQEFATFLEERLKKICASISVPTVIPVPLHWWRERRRGFNQAELVARTLAEHLNESIELSPIFRHRYTHPQTLSATGDQKKERALNVRGAFAVRPEIPVPDMILLVDDVWTTGATMTECCKVLKQAGASWVWGVTLLRA